jgi:hypothetical protein
MGRIGSSWLSCGRLKGVELVGTYFVEWMET